MSMFLEVVIRQADLHPDRVAFRNAAHQEITYSQLDKKSDALAQYLLRNNGQDRRPGSDSGNKSPVGVYGHKDPAMLVSMVACMKAGCPYVVLDTSFPQARIDGILQQLEGALVLSTVSATPEFTHAAKVVSKSDLENITMLSCNPVPSSEHIAGDDLQYILFTSGSTGAPKGVMQRAETIDCMMQYFSKFIPADQQQSVSDQGLVCFNRVPFSFDASLFDMVTALPYGHTMFSLEEASELDLRSTFEALSRSGLAM